MLRELLQKVGNSSNLNNLSSLDTYILLKALVEAVEPEEHICGKCHWYGLSRGCLYAWPEGGKHEAPASDDACGGFRRKEPRHTELADAVEPEDTPTDEQYNDARDARIRFLHDALVEARSDWARVSTDCHELKIELEKSRSELGKAKVEIESWTRRCHELERLLACDKASVADAELGELVRGMAENTRLTRFYTGYAVEAQQRFSIVWVNVPEEIRPTGRVLLGARYADPVEALRAIQEVGDA